MKTEKNYGMKNLKEKKMNVKKWRSGEVLMNFFIYKKFQLAKKYVPEVLSVHVNENNKKSTF